MNKNLWIIFFVIALSLNLAGIIAHNEILQYISKPFLVPFLIIYFIYSTHNRKQFTPGLLPALFFAWIANVLVMFQHMDEVFFLLGLGASLVAHIFYIIFFNRVRVQENIHGRWWILLIVIVYYAIIMRSLSYTTQEMTIPIRIFGVVICFMCMLALHMMFLVNKKAGRLMAAGALMFIVSDTLLGLNRFRQPFELADFFIILSYALAQVFIVTGAARYIT